MPTRLIVCAWALLGGAAAGCARVPVIAGPAGPSLCRSSIDDAGRPSGHLAWVSPDDPDDHEPLAAWCAAVGPAVVMPEPGRARVDDDALPHSLAIVTWNVHVGGGDVPGLVAAIRRGGMTDGLPVDHVVLLLQEAFRGGSDVPGTAAPSSMAARIAAQPPGGVREDIVATARRLGMSLYYVPSMRNGPGVSGELREDRGNAILSTLPLSDFTAIELPFDRQRRVAIAATIVARDRTGAPRSIRVASTHLNASAGASRLWLFASGLRASQARSLARALGPREPAILGSDLNTWADGPREAAVRELTRWFPDTGPFRLQATFRLVFRLDYLFFRLPDGWTAATRRVDDRFGSDHHPLLGWVEMG